MAASQRPLGYYEDVTAMGRIESDVLFLSDDAYRALQMKYRVKEQGADAAQPRIIANAIGAASRLAKATMKGEKVRTSQSEIERRLSICRACEHFVDNPMKCRKCGCFLNLKTRMETEHCPIQKW